MSILTGDDEELLSSIVKFKITDDALDAMRERVHSLQKEVLNSEEMMRFEEQLNGDQSAAHLLENWKSEYYNMMK